MPKMDAMVLIAQAYDAENHCLAYSYIPRSCLFNPFQSSWAKRFELGSDSSALRALMRWIADAHAMPHTAVAHALPPSGGDGPAVAQAAAQAVANTSSTGNQAVAVAMDTFRRRWVRRRWARQHACNRENRGRQRC